MAQRVDKARTALWAWCIGQTDMKVGKAWFGDAQDNLDNTADDNAAAEIRGRLGQGYNSTSRLLLPKQGVVVYAYYRLSNDKQQ
jgi:hypothetical protein